MYKLKNGLPFLPERIKIVKVEQLVADLYDKTEYVFHIRNSKQPWNQGLVLKEMLILIKLKQNVWLK